MASEFVGSEFVGKERSNEVQEPSTRPDVHPDISVASATGISSIPESLLEEWRITVDPTFSVAA